MKKNLKTACAKVTAVALALTLIASAAPADTAAAKAKKPALSKTKATITVGKSLKITVKKAKPKKTTWTVNKAGKKVVKLSKKTKKSVTIKGKKAGKATITAKIKVGKKTYKKKVKVTVKKKTPPKVTPNVSGTGNPKVTPTAPGGSTQPTPNGGGNGTPDPSPSASGGAATATPEGEKYSPIPPVQPDKPTTPAKVLPELNLREEAATEWSKAGTYGSAVFNTDDTVTYNSEPWAANDTGTAKKAGSVYNNGVAWYLDATNKGQVDMTGYTHMELTIKTEAEVALIAWAGTKEASNFWDKTDVWGGSSSKVENADGSVTISYPITTVFANAAKAKKAIAVGITLKSFDGVADSDEHFVAQTATIYSIKFVNSGGTATPTPPASGGAATPTPPASGGAATATPVPEEPIKTLETTGFTTFTDLGVTKDATKTYTSITVKIKAYDGTGALINSENENYGALGSYPKITVGTTTSCTNDYGLGYGDGVGGHTSDYSKTWGMYNLNNLGKYGVTTDETGYFNIELGLEDYTNVDSPVVIAQDTYDGFGFQNSSAEDSVSKIEIYSITLNEKK